MNDHITQTIVIQLNRGYQTVIDAVDADLLDLTWGITVMRGRPYARHAESKNGKHSSVLLHRVILERMLGRPLSKSEVADHADNDPLNNTRANLRVATMAQNSWNQGKVSKRNRSGFKGVSWSEKSKKWRAFIQAGGVHKYLGLYDTPEAAYAVYCEAAKQLHGEFARLD